MDIDCKNRCGDRKKKGVNLMTGKDLIKWIQDNHAEDIQIWATDDGCGIYPVNSASVVTDDRYGDGVTAAYIRLDE